MHTLQLAVPDGTFHIGKVLYLVSFGYTLLSMVTILGNPKWGY